MVSTTGAAAYSVDGITWTSRSSSLPALFNEYGSGAHPAILRDQNGEPLGVFHLASVSDGSAPGGLQLIGRFGRNATAQDYAPFVVSVGTPGANFTATGNNIVSPMRDRPWNVLACDLHFTTAIAADGANKWVAELRTREETTTSSATIGSADSSATAWTAYGRTPLTMSSTLVSRDKALQCFITKTGAPSNGYAPCITIWPGPSR